MPRNVNCPEGQEFVLSPKQNLLCSDGANTVCLGDLCIYFVCFVSFCTMNHLAAVKLLCLKQKGRSLEEHLEEFLSLVPATLFPDDCFCSFLHATLTTATKAQLCRESPRRSFAKYVEWVLVSCDSPLTVDVIYDDTSPTPNPKHHQTVRSCSCEPVSAATCEPALLGATKPNIVAEPKQHVSE